jgi:hypothetical protein
MTLDETECELLALPAFVKNPFVIPVARTIGDSAAAILARHHIIEFNGRFMIEVDEPYSHFMTLDKERFDRIAYPLLRGSGRTYINDVYAFMRATVEDLSHNDHFVLFGDAADPKANVAVWDMDSLEVRSDIPPSDCVWRSPYTATPVPIMGEHDRIEFIMQLAGGDAGLYDDIMQSLAPLVMAKKPDGVIWWAGTDPGKGMLMNALHKLFPNQLTAITPKRLTGNRLNYLLNTVLGNVIAEECELRLDDLGTCKLMSDHEDYFRHRFHTQDGQTINGNVHHIFSVSDSASISNRRWGRCGQTFVIPFNQQTDASQAQTLNREVYSQLVAEMCRYAAQIKQQGYRYEWSATTQDANAEASPDSKKPEIVASNPSPSPLLYNW